MFDLSETVCALSTAPGRAGIAVVRVSGPAARTAVERVFRPYSGGPESLPARQATLGKVIDTARGGEIDQAVVTLFPGPNSYTGEDVAEISVHGSPVIISALLSRLCAGGVRLATPGEFTLRAFLHGRIDLVQAEAIRDIIEATTLYQARVAARQRAGELSRGLTPVKELIVDAAVTLETALEFAEEDLALDSRETLAARLEEAEGQLRGWMASFRRGRLVRDGFSLAVIGLPNVGKSSIFNALLLHERSIVTDIPGTTRDVVSEYTSLGGIPVRLVDTAGVRTSADRLESLGVDRSYQAMADADAILLVVDGSSPASEEDRRLKERIGGLSCIVAVNKRDLPPARDSAEILAYAGAWPRVDVSARTGAGMEALRSEILGQLLGGAGLESEGVLVTNARHYGCLEGAVRALGEAGGALRRGLSEEFVLFELRGALQELGRLTGEVTTEDILGEIFSRFCVGK